MRLHLFPSFFLESPIPSPSLFNQVFKHCSHLTPLSLMHCKLPSKTASISIIFKIPFLSLFCLERMGNSTKVNTCKHGETSLTKTKDQRILSSKPILNSSNKNYLLQIFFSLLKENSIIPMFFIFLLNPFLVKSFFLKSLLNWALLSEFAQKLILSTWLHLLRNPLKCC